MIYAFFMKNKILGFSDTNKLITRLSHIGNLTKP